MSTSRPELKTEEAKKPFIINIDGSEEIVSEKVFRAFQDLNKTVKLATLALMFSDMKNMAEERKSNKKSDSDEDLGALLAGVAAAAAKAGKNDKSVRKPSFSNLFGGRNSSSSDSEEGPGLDISQLLSGMRPS